jgi:hypothetical protein
MSRRFPWIPDRAPRACVAEADEVGSSRLRRRKRVRNDEWGIGANLSDPAKTAVQWLGHDREEFEVHRTFECQDSGRRGMRRFDPAEARRAKADR